MYSIFKLGWFNIGFKIHLELVRWIYGLGIESKIDWNSKESDDLLKDLDDFK